MVDRSVWNGTSGAIGPDRRSCPADAAALGTLGVVTSQTLIDDLRAVVGDAHVLTDADLVATYETDWTGRFRGDAAAVVRPGSIDEVAGVVGACRAHRAAMVPQGGNTGLVGGSVPIDHEVVVSTARLNTISDVDEDAGTGRELAGVTLAAVQAAAADAGWRYAVDLAARDTATVGGMVATNAGGLRVFRFGSTRRQLLGVEAVLGTGDVVRRIGGLVKDNTGLDLAGLLCGSEGTLGIVTRARLALVPAAGETVTALVGLSSIDVAMRAVGSLRRSVPGLEAVEVVFAAGAALVAEQTGAAPVLDPIPPVQLVVEAVGPPDPTQSLQAALAAVGGVLDVAVATDAARSAQLWHVREAHTDAISRVGVPVKYDVTLPARALPTFCAQVREQVIRTSPDADTVLFGHLADGNVHVNVLGIDGADATALDDAVLGLVVSSGGSISAEHGIGRAKRAWLERDRGAGDVAAMAAVRRALDPDGICNPGVLVSPR